MKSGAQVTLKITGAALLAITALITSCDKPQTHQTPVRFEVTALESKIEPYNTNAVKVSGIVRARDGALMGKVVLLHLKRGQVFFKDSGITEQCTFGNTREVILTNGLGALEMWFFPTQQEWRAIGSQLSSPSCSFGVSGYSVLQPATIEIH